MRGLPLSCNESLYGLCQEHIMIFSYVLLFCPSFGLHCSVYECMLFCHDYRLSKSRVVNRSNTMDMPVRNNLSYVTTPSPRSTTKTSGAAPPVAGSADTAIQVNPEDEAQCDGPNYSCLGPQYETIDSRRKSQSLKNQAHARLLSERYEYSEAHCVAATDGGEFKTEESANYEVPVKQGTESEDYSHLKY